MGHTPNKIGAVILIGGESKRMGQNKYQLSYQGQTFVQNITNSFQSLNPVYSVHNIVSDLNLEQQIVDQTERIGPIGGIYSAINQSKNEFTFVCSCDLPKVSEELVMYLMGKCYLHQTSVIAMVDQKLIPTFAIYHNSVQKHLTWAIANNDYKLMNFISTIKHQVVKIPDIFKDELLNINHPDDYFCLKQPYIFAVSGFKNSGKTTLITKLITIFKSKNLRVACLKHDGHDFAIDPITDTGKFVLNQADQTTIYSKHKSQTTIIGTFDIDNWLNSLTDIDIVIIEGMKASNYPKVVITNGEDYDYTNCLIKVDQVTRNDVDMIYETIRKEYYAR